MNPTLAAWISTGWCIYVDIKIILGASTTGITLCMYNKSMDSDAEYPYNYLRPVVPWMQKFGCLVESTTLPPVASVTHVMLSGSGTRKRKSPVGGSVYGIPRNATVSV